MDGTNACIAHSRSRPRNRRRRVPGSSRIALTVFAMSTITTGRTRRSTRPRRQATMRLRGDLIPIASWNRGTMPITLSVACAPMARSSGTATMSSSARRWPASRSGSSRPRRATGWSVSPTSTSVASCGRRKNSLALRRPGRGAAKRDRNRSGKLLPMSPVQSVTHDPGRSQVRPHPTPPPQARGREQTEFSACSDQISSRRAPKCPNSGESGSRGTPFVTAVARVVGRSPMPDALDLLKTRRSIKPIELAGPGPAAAEIETLLTIAARVPDHGKLAPWRFIIFEGEARLAAGAAIAAAFRAKYPDAKAEQIEAERRRLARAPLVIAVVSRARPHVKIPEWEQVLSAGAAAMSLVLAAHALGYGASWITEWYAYDRDVLDALGLQESERIAGFVHIGRPSGPPEDRPRPPLEEIATRFE